MKNKEFSSPSDHALRQLLHSRLPESMPSPWFTRKVLNRLPRRRYVIASGVEYLLYIFGIIIAGVMSVNFVLEKSAPGTAITVGDLGQFALMVGSLGVLLAMFVTSLMLPADE